MVERLFRVSRRVLKDRDTSVKWGGMGWGEARQGQPRPGYSWSVCWNLVNHIHYILYVYIENIFH